MQPNRSPDLPTTLGGLARFAEQRGEPANCARLDELKQRLIQQTFNLVVFGEFKRGKTTFINALIGQELLPAAVVPLTSAVTILHWGEEPAREVEFLDGHAEHPELGLLPDYVTERGNPHNEKRVKLVRVAAPSELLCNGMQLVDTPGVGSVYEHNTEATREFLPHVDGAILLVASDPPISQGECQFLLEMQPHVSRLFVVQNKIDQLSPEEVRESLEFTRGVLREVLGLKDVRVYPISARRALQARAQGSEEGWQSSGLPAFLEDLRRFQATEQARTLVRSVVRSALAVAEDLRLGLDLERQALHMSVQDVEQRSATFRRRRDELLSQREDDTTLIRAEVRRIVSQRLQRDYEQERRERVPELRGWFARWAIEHENTAPGDLIERGNEFIREALLEVISRWRETEQARLEEGLTGSLERFTARANQTLAEIHELAREVFELPPRSVETVRRLAAPSRFRWQDWRWVARPGLSGSRFGGLLPGARARVLAAVERTLLEEHEKACGRLRHDFAQRPQAAFDEYIAAVDQSLSEAIAGIDRAIERTIAQKQRTEERAEEGAQRVAGELAELEAWTAALRSALPQAPEGVLGPGPQVGQTGAGETELGSGIPEAPAAGPVG